VTGSPDPARPDLAGTVADGNGTPGARPLRSQRWFEAGGVSGLFHRAYLKSEGFSAQAFRNRPVIGILNPWSELVNCHGHFRGMADAVRRGIQQAGGMALEFPAMSLGEVLMKPTTMLFRNLMAMDVEETIRANPLDAVVLLAGCDKTIPAALMGAISVDLPAIMVTGGPTEPAMFCGRQLGGATDVWRFTDDLRAGRMSQADYDQLETALVPSSGHCPEMGTASTMSALAEALGLALPGSAAIPAVDARRGAMAEATGRQAVRLALDGVRPSSILTADAFDNAITLLMALGGSTNAVIHLLALAGRAGVGLSLDRFDELSRRTPVIVNVRPSGEFLVEQLFHAGGIPAVLGELLPLLHADAPTVTGATLGEGARRAEVRDRTVIAALAEPISPVGSIAVLSGNLAPGGAVIKTSAATAGLLQHRGQAAVFADIDDLARRVDDPGLDVTADSVLILQNAGPLGAPGMPEWGHLPIPRKLLQAGVTDMVRISDARMSGTSFGTIVLHVAPESAAGGPLALVEDGDVIELDVAARRLHLDVPDAELARRAARLRPRAPHYRRGYGALYLTHVQQADQGCDFDFLRKLEDEPFQTDPLGLDSSPH
jgi:dihydroxy-acid dehydratase